MFHHSFTRHLNKSFLLLHADSKNNILPIRLRSYYRKIIVAYRLRPFAHVVATSLMWRTKFNEVTIFDKVKLYFNAHVKVIYLALPTLYSMFLPYVIDIYFFR